MSDDQKIIPPDRFMKVFEEELFNACKENIKRTMSESARESNAEPVSDGGAREFLQYIFEEHPDNVRQWYDSADTAVSKKEAKVELLKQVSDADSEQFNPHP